MVKYSNIKTGDIIEFTNPKIEKKYRRSFRGGPYTMGFVISGIRGSHPYANGLVKKKFIAHQSCPNSDWPELIEHPLLSLTLYMIDNYKPGFLGRGYQLQVYPESNLKYLKKIQRILNIKDLPSGLKRIFYTNTVLNDYSLNKLNKSSKTTNDKIAFMRKNFLMLPGMPTNIQWVFLNISNKRCRHCDVSLLHTRTSLIDLEMLKYKESIVNRVGEYLINVCQLNKDYSISIFPTAYRCGNCGILNFIINASYEKEISNQNRNRGIRPRIKNLMVCMKFNKECDDEIGEAVMSW